MGDAADDAFDDALREEEVRAVVITALSAMGCECKGWPIIMNDNGLYECIGCGRETDY